MAGRAALEFVESNRIEFMELLTPDKMMDL